MSYLLLGTLSAVTIAVAFVAIVIWSARPTIYEPINRDELQRFLRAWGEMHIDAGGIFDIMAVTVIQHHLVSAP